MSHYSIISSLNDDKIYIKIINTITYLCYEGNFNIDNFKVMISIEDIYDICLKSFGEMTYKISIYNKFIKLIFDEFELILKHTLLSIEQLTINYHKQVCENTVLTKKLQKACESLDAKISENSILIKRLEEECETCEISLVPLKYIRSAERSELTISYFFLFIQTIKSMSLFDKNIYYQYLQDICPRFVKINTNKISIYSPVNIGHDDNEQYYLYKNIENLCKLEILFILSSYNPKYMNSNINSNYIFITNINIKKIIIMGEQTSHDNLKMDYIFKNCPNLCEIEIIQSPGYIFVGQLSEINIDHQANHHHVFYPPIDLKDCLQKYPNKIKSIKTFPKLDEIFIDYLISMKVAYQSL